MAHLDACRAHAVRPFLFLRNGVRLGLQVLQQADWLMALALVLRGRSWRLSEGSMSPSPQIEHQDSQPPTEYRPRIDL